MQGFRYLTGTGARPACRLEGGRGSVGIGPQGRESVLRHSARAWGIVGIDSGGPESPQVTLKRNPVISQKSPFFKKMTICASGPQNPTQILLSATYGRPPPLLRSPHATSSFPTSEAAFSRLGNRSTAASGRRFLRLIFRLICQISLSLIQSY